MIQLPLSLQAWGTEAFSPVIKQEIQNIDPDLLPLQKGLSLSSYVSKQPISATILNSYQEDDTIIVKAGIFYSGIIAGCSCSDDPSPLDEQNEYCEILIHIHSPSADTQVFLNHE